MEDSSIEQFKYFPVAVYLKAFYDFGYVDTFLRYRELGQNLALANKWLHGAGAGADIVTLYDIVFRFEYAFARDGRTAFYFNVRKEF